MAPNPECDGFFNAYQEEGSTQTECVVARRCALESIDYVLGSQVEAGRDSSRGIFGDCKNSVLQLILKALYGLKCSKKVNKSTQTFVNPVVSEGERLARVVVFYFLQEELHLVQEDQLSLCLRSVVAEMLQKHDLVFTRMVNCLRITPATARVSFNEVANHLFTSGGVTWGRIVALYAFASRLAMYCKDKHMERLSRSIPLFMTDYIEEKVAPFVEKHGGWDQLCAEFPTEEYVNGRVWRYLLMTSMIMGVIAVGYSLSRTHPHQT